MNNRISKLAWTSAFTLGSLMLQGCGGGDLYSGLESSASSSSSGSSATCNSTTYPDLLGSKLTKYRSDGQCGPQTQAAESYRQAAIANCQAGSLSAASTYYNSYYKQSVSVVNAMCP